MNKKKGLIIAVIIAAVLAAVLLLLIFLPKGGNNEVTPLDEGVSMRLSVDENGMHQAIINTDKEGNIENNSYGTLLSYKTADVKTVHIENTKGTLDVTSTTPEGEATVYTIKGYEDFDLQGGNPDVIASSAASLDFTKVATLDKNKAAEFGFDKPRSTVTVKYSDDTSAVIIVGSDAPQGAGTYVKFGTGDAVYLVETDKVSAFDFGLTDLISLTINDAAETTDNGAVQSITISGTNYPKAITLEPNTNDNYSASFKLTAPVNRFANESESSMVESGLRGLYALSVKYVNPSDAQLKELGLDKPYAAVQAVYPDVTIELNASKPDGDGNVFLMKQGGNVVYTIAADKVAWCNTSYEKLCGEYVCYPKMTALSGINIKAGNKTYDFKISSTETVETDNEGSETDTTETIVKYGGKELEIGAFTSFYDELALITLADAEDAGSIGGTVLEVTYSFADGGSDTVTFCDKGNERYSAFVNKEPAGHAYKADITRVLNDVEKLVK